MRARMLQLHHTTVKMLRRCKKEAEIDGEYRVARRIHWILLNHQGRTSGNIATLIDAPLSRVSEWIKNYELLGYESLLEGQRSGRPGQLADWQMQSLQDILDSGPVAYGYLSGIWNARMIKRVIQDEFGVTFHRSHVCRILHQLGFSVQRPTRKLIRADPRAQNRWRRDTYPRLKKTRQHRGRP